ncbi:MAG TPA: glycosyltransferase [Allosphingosinicella sp.]|jgi:glycosyltransferase involved in cell wall biosynthesis
MLRVLTLSTLFPDSLRPRFGGFVARQTQALAAGEGVEVEVVAPVGLPLWPLRLHPRYRALAALPEQERWEGLTVHRPRFGLLPGFRPERNGRAMAKALLPDLRRLRKSFAFDVIDAEFFWPDGVAAMHLSRALGVPFSIKARGSDIHHWGAQPKVAAQMVAAAEAAGGLLAVSAALKASMVALGMPEAKIRVHYTGIDLERFSPVDKAAAKVALGVAGPLLVSIGALIPLKGHRLVLEALSALPGATLMLAGDGPERGALEALARTLGVAERVRFLRNIPHDALAGLLAAADAMVLPSEREGLANAWVEALACGTPLVITDVGGAREVVDRPEAGRIVEREPLAIAAAVRELIDHPPAPLAVRAAAERFSWKKNGAELAAHLASVASGDRHQGGGDPPFFAA